MKITLGVLILIALYNVVKLTILIFLAFYYY